MAADLPDDVEALRALVLDQARELDALKVFKACPCCSGALHRIGEDVSERLDVVPTTFRVLVNQAIRDDVGPDGWKLDGGHRHAPAWYYRATSFIEQAGSANFAFSTALRDRINCLPKMNSGEALMAATDWIRSPLR
jgi:hypothetical protein